MAPRARRIVVLVAVAALGGALVLWRSPGEAPVVDVPSDVQECASNLRRIHAALVRMAVHEQHPPSESGVRLLGALLASGTLEPRERECLTCPGPGAAPVPESLDHRDLAALTGDASAYAARDTVRFPLAKFPSGGSELEPIAACDNAHGMNHDGCMNVLYSDGSILTLFVSEEIERGRLAAGATTIPVGADSPIPDLRKLTQDGSRP
jgi:hypothetical protein